MGNCASVFQSWLQYFFRKVVKLSDVACETVCGENNSVAILTPLERAELDRLQSFVQSELAGAGAASTTSRVAFSDDGGGLTGSLTTTSIVGFQVCMSFQFGSTDAIMLAFQKLVFCPTLTDLNLRLPSPRDRHNSIWLVFRTVLLQVYSALGTSRSLSTLDITSSYVPEHVKAVDRCLSGNSSLRSCTLRMHPCRNYDLSHGRRHPLQKILRPFTTRVQSQANVGLKELVLKSTVEDPYAGCRVCQEAIANLVAHNTTLEKLEVGNHIFPNRGDDSATFVTRSVMARAVACNRTLKEIRFQCTVAELKEIVLVLVPNADGRQANMSLSTLKLFLTEGGSVLDCMTNLEKLVESNTTLKLVQLSQKGWRYCNTLGSWGSWEGSSKQNEGEKGLELRVRGELERMLKNELRRNASLQSLRVGWWTLLRVGTGHEWQMKYKGPCLAPLEEYVVKLKMR